ncbi:MAG TPA: ATP-binding protein [Chloroflexia bacterium]|nr:ATP-binding protein [Chloroflexia bacterium]
MSADELIQYLSWAFYIVIFIQVTLKAVRRPYRANVDIALFFIAVTIVIALTVATRTGFLLITPLERSVVISFVLSLAYLLVRLVDDFSVVPTWVKLLSEVSLVILIIASFIYNDPTPLWLTFLQILHLDGFLLYVTVAFFRESRRASGVTKRRMAAIAVGTICLFLEFIAAGLSMAQPQYTGFLRAVTDLLGLASGISYYFGFATPGLLRRAWQEPELRAFLGRAANLPRLPNTEAIIHELQKGAASAVGAPHARIGLWDEDKKVLFYGVDGARYEIKPEMTLTSGRAFLTQKPAFTPYLKSDNPLYADASRVSATALLAAPITAGEKRLGTLVAYAPRAPIFADEDLELVQLLADQAAVILESRGLIDEAARVQAHEEATRLKDDFLSAAAHDLKTPLTTLVGQTQLLERKALRTPDAPADLASIRKLGREVERLRTLVLELLDAASAEQGKLLGTREEVNLVSLALETCSRHASERHACQVEAGEDIQGMYDARRIQQLIENLVENAIKYSPDGGKVTVKLWHDTGWNYISVADEGIGIPQEDLAHVFDRFHRGTNVDDRRFAGMGLGLFICRGIAEQHGGRIWAESKVGEGSTFHVALPLSITESEIAGASTT